jgi:hypothetical protein
MRSNRRTKILHQSRRLFGLDPNFPDQALPLGHFAGDEFRQLFRLERGEVSADRGEARAHFRPQQAFDDGIVQFGRKVPERFGAELRLDRIGCLGLWRGGCGEQHCRDKRDGF